MPKKSTTVRGGAQRNKPKVQKSFELVKPSPASSTNLTDSIDSIDSTDEQEVVAVSEDEVTTSDVSASPLAVETPVEETKPRVTKQSERKARVTPLAVATPAEAKNANNATSATSTPVASTAPKGSASARLAARRQAMQKVQQRAAASLITSEHYSYVRRDLRFIAILAAIMFTVIIILHFVPGIGS